jgi:hypothetical protein
VLALLAAGSPNTRIAEELVVALDTVKMHGSHLLGKLGVAKPHRGRHPGTPARPDPLTRHRQPVPACTVVPRAGPWHDSASKPAAESFHRHAHFWVTPTAAPARTVPRRTTPQDAWTRYHLGRAQRLAEEMTVNFTEDLAKFDVPTLVLHGEDDLVPVKASAVKSARLIKGPPRRSATRAPPRHHSHSPGSGQRGAAGLPGELATQRGFLGSSRPHARTHRSSGAFHGATGGPDRDPDASAGLRVAGSTVARNRKR